MSDGTFGGSGVVWATITFLNLRRTLISPEAFFIMSIPKAKKPLKIAVLGPAGFGGSYVCVELINRGHHVTGISRNPHKLGTHKLYSTVSLDLQAATIDELAEAFEGHDVVIEYLPMQKFTDLVNTDLTQLEQLP